MASIDPVIRPYDAERDLDAVRRVWLEAGWIDAGEYGPMDHSLAAASAVVGELDGRAECLVLTVSGTVRHLKDDVPMAAVTGVTTSHVARRQGLAGRATARAIADDVANGALVSSLGIFDQGYYDKLGFGNGPYRLFLSVDAAELDVPPATRPPVRLSCDDWAEIHASRVGRLRRHGACNLDAAETTAAEMKWAKNPVALGYRDGPGGALSHHVFMGAKDDPEHGPYDVHWLAYRTYDELLELLGILRNLADQVYAFRMEEPPGILLQDLMHRPLRRQRLIRNSAFESRLTPMALWQMRMNDVAGCLERTRLPRAKTRFNVELTDPLEACLDAGSPWRGVAGSYRVELGSTCSATAGADPALPTLRASVNAFTRLWLGVRPATGLAVTDDLDGPAGLLEALDGDFCLPIPHIDWDF